MIMAMTMALEHTLSSSPLLSKEFSVRFGSRNRVRKLQIAPFSSFLPLSLSTPGKQLRHARCFPKSSVTETYSNYAGAYPKPSEIPWKKELSNSASLIGTVGTPVEIKHLASGKAVAWMRLAVWKSSTDTSWINLTFWDDLARVAFQHVRKGDQIYVSGRLVADMVEADDGKQQTYYKVVVQQLNFIERTSSIPLPYDQDSIVAGRKLGIGSADNMGSTEALWQAFFANPVDWWDNRKNKKNPKYPDFKHKDTGEALWVEGRYNPHWVKSQLEILDMRMGSLVGQEARMQADFANSVDIPSF